MEDVTKRVNYFDRQFLRAGDFQDEQAYHIDRRRRHNAGFHSYGVVDGLEVVKSDVAGHVNIETGWAVDELWREIVLATPRKNVPTGGVAVGIYISYPKPEPLSDPSADPGVTDRYTRVHEEPVVTVASPDAAPANAIQLATASANGKIVDKRQFAGLKNDITACSLTLKCKGVDDSKKWPKLSCSGSLRINTEHGHVDIGPRHTGWSHFVTDLPKFYFNKEIRVNGPPNEESGRIGSYDGKNLELCTSGTARIAVLNSNGNVGIGTPEESPPTEKLEVNGNIKADKFKGDGSELENLPLTPDNDWTIAGSNVYRTTGNVGIGTAPGAGAKLHVKGNMRIEEGLLSVGVIQIGLRGGPPFGGEDYNGINCEEPLHLNAISRQPVVVGHPSEGFSMYDPAMTVFGNLRVTGTITGTKDGYVTDRFVNQSGDALEQGDVVVFGGRSAKVYYGAEDNIPVPEADLTTTAYDHRVCGVVAEILVEDPWLPQAEEKPETGGKAKRGAKAQSVPDDGIKRLQVFSSEELQTLDRKRVGKGQIAKMVTLGCFAHCKVDADIAPIEVGDLLTTSPTKGRAQKVLEPEKAIGAIIGKALGARKKGKGKIPVLVMLQ